MRIFAILALLLGIALAGGAVRYMYGQFKAMEARLASQQVEPPIPTVMVAVAKEELRFGQKIGPDSVQLVKWPEEVAPANGFSSVEDLFKEGEEQRTVLRQMEVNEPILKTKITGFGEEANVAALLKRGMRAHTLGVDAKSSVAGFLFPGSLVDIYLTYNGANGQRTKLLLERAEIIAVDQTTDRDQIKAQVARTVTLQVTPEDSQRLILAERIGQLSFNMRGFEDYDTVSTSEDSAAQKDLSVTELLGIVVEEEVVEEKGKVRVNRGIGNTTEKEIDAAPSENEPAAPAEPASTN